jgi:hypothetical protein
MLYDCISLGVLAHGLVCFGIRCFIQYRQFGLDDHEAAFVRRSYRRTSRRSL